MTAFNNHKKTEQIKFRASKPFCEALRDYYNRVIKEDANAESELSNDMIAHDVLVELLNDEGYDLPRREG